MLPVSVIGDVVALDARGKREALGIASHPLAFVIQRPWIGPAVQILLDDPGDHQQDPEDEHDLPGGDFGIGDGQDSDDDRHHAEDQEEPPPTAEARAQVVRRADGGCWNLDAHGVSLLVSGRYVMGVGRQAGGLQHPRPSWFLGGEPVLGADHFSWGE